MALFIKIVLALLNHRRIFRDLGKASKLSQQSRLAKMITLTFSQCKTIANNTQDLRGALESLNDQPNWLVEMGGVEVYDIMSINQGGCASGAYMPAVTYSTANDIMHNHGNSIMQYIEDNYGELPEPPRGETWSGRACFYVAIAVELWCIQHSDSLDSLEY